MHCAGIAVPMGDAANAAPMGIAAPMGDAGNAASVFTLDWYQLTHIGWKIYMQFKLLPWKWHFVFQTMDTKADMVQIM